MRDLGDFPPNLGPPSGKRGRGNLAVYFVQGMRSVHAGCMHRRVMLIITLVHRKQSLPRPES